MINLAGAVDNTQEYMMQLAKRHGPITVTFKNEEPFVTIFLGEGSEAPIGFGSSVAAALLSAMKSQK